MIDHSGRLAVVTGGARGLGKAIARALAQGKARVALLDINGDGAREAASEIATQTGAATWSHALDVSRKEEVMYVFSRLAEDFGPADILVNNAGITTNVHPIADMPLDDWDREVAINLSGAFYCAKQVLPGMSERGWGRVIDISSLAGAIGGFGQVSYSASKAGLLGLTKTIALEYARKGITANAVLPGLANTAAAAAIPEHLRERIINTVPSRRIAEPEEIASVVSFLASAGASYVNGAEMFVTGGAELFTF